MVDLRSVFEQFNSKCKYLSAAPYGSGHIHDTFSVITEGEESDNFILQRLNTNIFKDIRHLQENIQIVTRHIRKKLEKEGYQDLDRRVLTVIETVGGGTYHEDSNGNFWRLYIFIKDHISYDIVESTHQAFEGGKAIGRFQAYLADLDSSRLHETIPFFHDIEKRIDTFRKVVAADPLSRVKGVSREISFVFDREEKAGTILRLGRAGKIPLRTTHNDTKFNNVLLDMYNRALCVIDLDTVMPGYIHYDFGDAIRTATNSSSEDETDLSAVFMDINLFRAYSDGYLSEVYNTLTSTELDYLALAPLVITFTIGVRFLTDYLDGDRYFKTHHPGHNLERARTQFKLVESNEEQYEVMQGIISELVEKYKKQK